MSDETPFDDNDKLEAVRFVTNDTRAKWGTRALAAYPPSRRRSITDELLIARLIGDLMHLARQRRIDPLRLVERSVGAFIGEEEALDEADDGPLVHVGLVILLNGEHYETLGKKGRRLARKERERRRANGSRELGGFMRLDVGRAVTQPDGLMRLPFNLSEDVKE
jgi:hypothetical protein